MSHQHWVSFDRPHTSYVVPVNTTPGSQPPMHRNANHAPGGHHINAPVRQAGASRATTQARTTVRGGTAPTAYKYKSNAASPATSRTAASPKLTARASAPPSRSTTPTRPGAPSVQSRYGSSRGNSPANSRGSSPVNSRQTTPERSRPHSRAASVTSYSQRGEWETNSQTSTEQGPQYASGEVSIDPCHSVVSIGKILCQIFCSCLVYMIGGRPMLYGSTRSGQTSRDSSPGLRPRNMSGQVESNPGHDRHITHEHNSANSKVKQTN